MSPSSEQLIWLDNLRTCDLQAYQRVYPHISTVSWDDPAFLFNDKNLLLSLDFKTSSFLMYKHLRLILKYKPAQVNFNFFYYLICNNLAAYLLEPRESLELIYQWMQLDEITFKNPKDGKIYINQSQRWRHESQDNSHLISDSIKTTYLTIKHYLFPSQKNALYYKDFFCLGSINEGYYYDKNDALYYRSCLSHVQFNWVMQALEVEQIAESSVELGEYISCTSWDKPEFLNVCRFVFYSSQFETAWFIARKYIELSLSLNTKTPVASIDLMFFLYKNLGAILHSTIQDLEMLLTWFETVYIPPRTLQQLAPDYEQHLAGYQKRQPLDQSKSSESIEDMHPVEDMVWDAERTVYKTLKEFLLLQSNATHMTHFCQ